MVKWNEKSEYDRLPRQPTALVLVLQRCFIYAAREYVELIKQLPTFSSEGIDPKVALWYHCRHMREVYLRLRVLCGIRTLYESVNKASSLIDYIDLHRQRLRYASREIFPAIWVPSLPRPVVNIAANVLQTGTFPYLPLLMEHLVRCVGKDVCIPKMSSTELKSIEDRINTELRVEYVRSKVPKVNNGRKVVAKVEDGQITIGFPGEFALTLLSDFNRWLVMNCMLFPHRPFGLSATPLQLQFLEKILQLSIEEFGRRVAITNNRAMLMGEKKKVEVDSKNLIQLDALAVASRVSHVIVSLTVFVSLQEQASQLRNSLFSNIFAWGSSNQYDIEEANKENTILQEKRRRKKDKKVESIVENEREESQQLVIQDIVVSEGLKERWIDIGLLPDMDVTFGGYRNLDHVYLEPIFFTQSKTKSRTSKVNVQEEKVNLAAKKDSLLSWKSPFLRFLLDESGDINVLVWPLSWLETEWNNDEAQQRSMHNIPKLLRESWKSHRDYCAAAASNKAGDEKRTIPASPRPPSMSLRWQVEKLDLSSWTRRAGQILGTWQLMQLHEVLVESFSQKYSWVEMSLQYDNADNFEESSSKSYRVGTYIRRIDIKLWGQACSILFDALSGRFVLSLPFLPSHIRASIETALGTDPCSISKAFQHLPRLAFSSWIANQTKYLGYHLVRTCTQDKAVIEKFHGDVALVIDDPSSEQQATSVVDEVVCNFEYESILDSSCTQKTSAALVAQFLSRYGISEEHKGCSELTLCVPGTHCYVKLILRGFSICDFYLIVPRRNGDLSITLDHNALNTEFACIPLLLSSSASIEFQYQTNSVDNRNNDKHAAADVMGKWLASIRKNMSHHYYSKGNLLSNAGSATHANNGIDQKLARIFEAMHQFISLLKFPIAILTQLATTHVTIDDFPYHLAPTHKMDKIALEGVKSQILSFYLVPAKRVLELSPFSSVKQQPIPEISNAVGDEQKSTLETTNEDWTLNIDTGRKKAFLCMSSNSLPYAPRLILPPETVYQVPHDCRAITIHMPYTYDNGPMKVISHSSLKECDFVWRLHNGEICHYDEHLLNPYCCRVIYTSGEIDPFSATPYMNILAFPSSYKYPYTFMPSLLQNCVAQNIYLSPPFPDVQRMDPTIFLMAAMNIQYNSFPLLGGRSISFDLKNVLRMLEACNEMWKSQIQWGGYMHNQIMLPNYLSSSFLPPWINITNGWKSATQVVFLSSKIKCSTQVNKYALHSSCRLASLSGVSKSQDAFYVASIINEPPNLNVYDEASGQLSMLSRYLARTYIGLKPYCDIDVYQMDSALHPVVKSQHIGICAPYLSHELSESNMSLSRTIARLVLRNIELHNAVYSVVSNRSRIDSSGVYRPLDKFLYVPLNFDTVRIVLFAGWRRTSLIISMHPSCNSWLRVYDPEIKPLKRHLASSAPSAAHETKQSGSATEVPLYTLKLRSACELLSWHATNRNLASSYSSTSSHLSSKNSGHVHDIKFLPGHLKSAVIEPLCSLLQASFALQICNDYLSNKMNIKPSLQWRNNIDKDNIQGSWVSCAWTTPSKLILPTNPLHAASAGSSLPIQQAAQLAASRSHVSHTNSASSMSNMPHSSANVGGSSGTNIMKEESVGEGGARALELVAQLVPVTLDPSVIDSFKWHASFMPSPIQSNVLTQNTIHQLLSSGNNAVTRKNNGVTCEMLLQEKIQIVQQELGEKIQHHNVIQSNIPETTSNKRKRTSYSVYNNTGSAYQSSLTNTSSSKMACHQNAAPAPQAMDNSFGLRPYMMAQDKRTLGANAASMNTLAGSTHGSVTSQYNTLVFSIRLVDNSFAEGISNIQKYIEHRFSARNAYFLTQILSLPSSINALPVLAPLFEAETRSHMHHQLSLSKNIPTKLPLLIIDTADATIKIDSPPQTQSAQHAGADGSHPGMGDASTTGGHPPANVRINNIVIRVFPWGPSATIDNLSEDIKNHVKVNQKISSETRLTLSISKLPIASADNLLVNGVPLPVVMNICASNSNNSQGSEWQQIIAQLDIRGCPVRSIMSALFLGKISVLSLTNCLTALAMLGTRYQSQYAQKK